MANKGVRSCFVLVLAVLLTACGRGKAERAFAAYEKEMDPVLSQEADLREQLNEKTQDMMAYNKAGVEALIRDRMVPFYAKMAEKVRKIHPKTPELEKIHQEIVRYVELRRESFADYLKFEADKQGILSRARNASVGAEKALSKALDDAKNRIPKVNTLLQSAPEDVRQSLGAVFGQDTGVRQRLEAAIASMKAGNISGNQFRLMVERVFRPYYEQALKKLESIKAEKKSKTLLCACHQYLEGLQNVLDVALKVADVRARVERPQGVLLNRAGSLSKQAEELFKKYKEDAQDYRKRAR